ncbi:uncharacterized protein [Littorina saxatilis]|uniref:Uncharacterized protein n=1 Tax=Littorina saxatilis TaxID=31220 RepID=A0AAN9GIZ2_9CAEN
MAPPQVNLNEKPRAQVGEDPLPEKPDSASTPVIVTVPRNGGVRCNVTAEQRRQRKRCRIACCASLSFILVLLLALGTACLVYRMKHRKNWKLSCRTQEGQRIPEHVSVDHAKQLIYVKPDHNIKDAMEMLHEYNRRLIAFKNGTAKTCYIDRLDETFEDGYARWVGYEETEHKMGRTLYVIPQKITVEVVKHIAGVHIFEHCGNNTRVEFYWVKEVTQEEIRVQPPASVYIKV